MDVTQIRMSKLEARDALEEYREAVIDNMFAGKHEEHAEFDRSMEAALVALSRGKRVLSIRDAMHKAGLDEGHRPKLAIAQANARFVLFKHGWSGAGTFASPSVGDREKYHTPSLWWPPDHHARKFVHLGDGTFAMPPANVRSTWMGKALVPTIPPRFRPKGQLYRYHILFEAEWEDVPIDPILLRHLGGPMYAVLAEWDLTELERMILAEYL